MYNEYTPVHVCICNYTIPKLQMNGLNVDRSHMSWEIAWETIPVALASGIPTPRIQVEKIMPCHEHGASMCTGSKHKQYLGTVHACGLGCMDMWVE